MANKLAAWQNQQTVNAVSSWWQERFPFNEANVGTVVHESGKPQYSTQGVTINSDRVVIDDLYELYYRWAGDWHHRFYRLNFDQFAKCVMAAKIMDIGGKWRMATDWNPTPDQIRRVTGNE
jgi:hypothetical protein